MIDRIINRYLELVDTPLVGRSCAILAPILFATMWVLVLTNNA